MRFIGWLLRAFIFFTLFAFALNNLQLATVHWFFGVEWRTPMVIVVLVAFAAGCVLGCLAMLPGWWRHRQTARRLMPALTPALAPALGISPASTEPASDAVRHPPRVGP